MGALANVMNDSEFENLIALNFDIWATPKCISRKFRVLRYFYKGEGGATSKSSPSY